MFETIIKVLRELDIHYHELFSISPTIPILSSEWKKMLTFPNFSGSGFFFILDNEGKYVRCGAIKDIKEYKMELSPRDTFMNISVAYWNDENGYRNMREYKQKFKNLIKKSN